MTKDELKKLFTDGRTPTQEDFAALIDGVKGDKGVAGFGTKAQYDDIIKRLKALETA